MGLIPKQTKAEVRIAGGLGLYRVLGGVVVLILISSIGKFVVADKLLLLFTIYALILYIILTSKSQNPKKVFASAMIDSLKFLVSKKEYCGVDVKEMNISDEEESDRQLKEILQNAEYTTEN